MAPAAVKSYSPGMRFLLVSIVVFLGCTVLPAAGPEAAPSKEKGGKTAGAPAKRTPPAPSPSAAARGSGSKPPASAKPATRPAPDRPSEEGPKACPSDMQLVEGEYCSDVKHECKKSWYDKSNKKTVCEEFEPRATCVGERTKKRFCIDRYSWPNVKGERPEVMNTFYQAQVKCAAVGKRMCTESEWNLACEGPEMKPFPYGYSRDVTKCNGDQPWDSPNMKKVAQRDPDELARLWRGVRNGEQPGCVSDFGVADLAGNTDDVVASETFTSDWKGKYSSLHTGGPWYRGVRNQCRPKIYTHDEGFYYYFLSFRCCGGPDGKENDPRTPKQIREKKSFESIERLARFTVKDMKEKLEQKKRGKCDCSPKDALCKTMCGTLLGPGARDVVLRAPSSPGPRVERRPSRKPEESPAKRTAPASTPAR